ncbi:glutathione synthetase [Qipengyuania marisflavi]|uniref:Glutathione synthetase n=1 Tax=Qipengyuania marisflavi TaxID=2486356 RepID=A0A5S3P0T3_9SPHN|nr:glutathione synthetase [Qipengyuania marisflavi]TMM46261.1 glutathione synthase [Qipengyuania marisflavi]
MRFAFFVNDLATEYPNYATTVLAHAAAVRGHEVCYVTPSGFVLSADDSLAVHGHFVPKKKYGTHLEFFEALKKVGKKAKKMDVSEIDVLMLRNDPSTDAQTTPWAEDIGILFGREAARRGVLVLNDPDALGRAINKLYFQSFPAEVRAETMITKNANDVKEFAEAHGGNIILKPLQGSGGSGVFKVDSKSGSNLNQIIEAIDRDGYIIAQSYVKAASKGDIRMFMMNGWPLKIGDKYCAMRRVASEDDIRSNIHAGGKAEAVEITDVELKVAELIRPRLIADGMFLVGVDIVGDKILEVNVFSPGNLNTCNKMAGVNFAVPIIESIERKIEIRDENLVGFPNKTLATM